MKRATQDIALGTGAISTPLWLQPAGDWMQFIGICIGVVLVAARLYLTIKEIRQNGPADDFRQR